MTTRFGSFFVSMFNKPTINFCSVRTMTSKKKKRYRRRKLSYKPKPPEEKPLGEELYNYPKKVEEPWKDPYKYAVREKTTTYSDFQEANVDWEYVKRLLPRRVIPEMPKLQDGQTTPSGWRAPRDNPPDLPYYIQRNTNHMPAIYLERRRDELNPKTMDFEYVELVILRNVYGDIFACERDLRNYIETRLNKPIATHVDELKGMIKIKGVDRTLVEQFVYDCENEFTLCKRQVN